MYFLLEIPMRGFPCQLNIYYNSHAFVCSCCLYTCFFCVLFYHCLPGQPSARSYTILYYTILYYTILYYTILYYTILYHTIV